METYFLASAGLTFNASIHPKSGSVKPPSPEPYCVWVDESHADNIASCDKRRTRFTANGTIPSKNTNVANGQFICVKAYVRRAAKAAAESIPSIHEKLNKFTENCAVLMHGLEIVGRIHPFVSGVCMR